MSLTTPTGPADLYRQLREGEMDAATAVEEVARSYGRNPREPSLRDTLRAAEQRHQEAAADAAVQPELEPEPEPDKFETARAEVEARMAALRDERQRLSLDALTDAGARKRLAAVERQLDECEAELDRVELARREQARRQAEAIEAAENERRQQALTHARELQAEREKAAHAVDLAAARFARELRKFDRITTEQETTLRRVGARNAADMARPRSWQIEAALMHALREAGCPHGIIALEAFAGPAHIGPGWVRPLAESDARPIEPAAPEGS